MVVLSKTYRGLWKRKPCPGASLVHLSQSSLKRSPKTAGSRLFMASASVDLATGSIPKVVQLCLVGQKSVADFPQGVLAGDLRVEAGEELSPGGEMLAVAVGAVRLGGFFKTISGYELEKLGKDGIVMHS